MIVCPVCEHPQQSGTECDVCGRQFAPGALPAPPIAPLEGLEVTSLVSREIPVDAGGPIPELEPTLQAPVDAPEENTPGVEPTRAAPVDVDAAEIPDLERQHAAIPGDAPTALPVAAVCRYCRTPAVPGERLCSRCGMRLPVIDVELVAGAGEGVHQCSNCGAVTSRPLCPACGNRLTPPTLE